MQGAIANFGIPTTGSSPIRKNASPRRSRISSSSVRRPPNMPIWVERVAPSGVNILMEKPFAASIADADRMIAAMQKTGKLLAINWPLAWYPLARHHQAPDRRRRDRRCHRGAFLRRQPRPALSSCRQGRGHPRGSPEGQAQILVLQACCRRRQPARLCRLWRDARHLVHERREAGRGHLRHGRAAGAGGRRAFGHRLPLLRAACRNSRPAGAPSPTRGRCSRSRNAASSSSAPTAPSPAMTMTDTSPSRRAPSRPPTVPARYARRAAPSARRIHAALHRHGLEDRGPLARLCRIGQQITDSAVLSAREKRTVALLP